MAAYLVLLALVALLSWAGYSSLRHGEGSTFTIFDLAAAVTLALFAGLRWMVGTDYRYYFRAYTAKMEHGYWWGSVVDTGQDVGFATLTYLSSVAGVNFYLFSFVIAAVTVAAAVTALWMLAPHPRSAVLLYVALAPYLVPLNAVRQGFAVSLVLLGYALAVRGWRWRLLPLAAFTVTMHYSSVVAMMALVGLHVAANASTPRRRWTAFGLTCAVPAAALVASLAAGAMPAGIGRYLTYLGEGGAGLGSAVAFGVRLAIIAASVAVLGSRRALSGQALAEFGAVTIGALFVAAAFNSLVFARFDHYFFPFAALLVPRLVGGTEHRRVVAGALIGVLALAYFVAYLNSWGGLLPYRTIFEGPLRFGTS